MGTPLIFSKVEQVFIFISHAYCLFLNLFADVSVVLTMFWISRALSNIKDGNPNFVRGPF